MSEAIGGFFALETLPAHRDSLLQHWTPPDSKGVITRHNARSVLRVRLEAIGIRRLWLPAYCCTALAEALPAAASLHFYEQDERLQLQMAGLFAQLKSGDAVVVIDYFGVPPAPDLITAMRNRPDIHWIEDRAHSLAAGSTAWGDDVLYSPRKLCGVPDGGLLFARKAGIDQIKPASLPTPENFADAALKRLQARNQDELADSYTSYRLSELAMQADDRAMSKLSLNLLQALPCADVLAQRRQNYQYLQQKLSSVSFLGEPHDYIPSHFVVHHTDAARIARSLQAIGIYAQRHWQTLAAPSTFTAAHQLSERLLSLPCDHRYHAEQMARIVQAVETLL